MMFTVIRSRRKDAVAPEEYSGQWKAVLVACKQCRKEIKGPSRAFFRYAEQLARPWVNIESIRAAGREIRADLLTQCRQIDRRLHGRSDRHHGLRVGLIVGAAAVVGMCVPLLWAVANGGDAAMVVERLRHWSYRLVASVEQASFGEKMAAGTVGMLVFGLWMMYAMRRD